MWVRMTSLGWDDRWGFGWQAYVVILSFAKNLAFVPTIRGKERKSAKTLINNTFGTLEFFFVKRNTIYCHA